MGLPSEAHLRWTHLSYPHLEGLCGPDTERPHRHDFPQRAPGIPPSTHVCRLPGPSDTGILTPKQKENHTAVGGQGGAVGTPTHPLLWAPVGLSPWGASSSYILLTSKKKGLQKPFRSWGEQDTKSTYIEYATNAKATRRASGPYSETVTFTLHRSPTRLCAFLDVPGSTGEDVLDGTRPSSTGEKTCDKSDLETALMREEQWLTRLSSVG